MGCKLTFTAILICSFASAEDKLERLNIVALDSQGQPAMGLQSADFQLWKDGKPQTIAFSRFTGARPLQTARPLPNEHSNRSAGLPPTVVLIDLLNDRLMSAAVINNDITRALRNFESSEGLYLYILTARGDLYPIHALPRADAALPPAEEPWTRNIAPMLQAALKEVFGFRPVDERDLVVRYDLTARALRTLGSQMRMIPGRKNLVWVTHGVPLYGTSISQQTGVDLTNPVRLLASQLEREQIVVYPVAQSTRGAAAEMNTESNQFLDEFVSLAGGRLYRSGGAEEAIQHAIIDSRSNYQVAYYSAPQDSDGKRHKLRVTSPRKDVRLHAKDGIYPVLPPTRPDDLARASLEIAAHSPFDATDIGLRASVTPDPDSKRGVRLDIRIDPSDLFLSQSQNQRSGKIAILFGVYSETGFEKFSPAIPSDVSLTSEQYELAARDGLAFRQTLTLGEPVRRVRIVVVDRELGTLGSVTVPVPR